MFTFVKSGSLFFFQTSFAAKFTKGCFASKNSGAEIPLF